MIKRKIIRGKIRYYAQLVCDGKPYQKEGNQVIQGKIGLDLGPSTIAEVSNTGAKLDLFCRELDSIQKEIRVLQRKLDRQIAGWSTYGRSERVGRKRRLDDVTC